MAISLDMVKLFLQRIKDFKELIAIVLFFGSGAMWTVSYFATRAELENYKCINNLTLTMLVNGKSAEFLSEVVRSAKRELRQNETLLRNTATDNANHQSVADLVEEQREKVEKLSRSELDAEKAKEEALKNLQEIQLGTGKSCK